VFSRAVSSRHRVPDRQKAILGAAPLKINGQGDNDRCPKRIDRS
jgi:hypothetical protein